MAVKKKSSTAAKKTTKSAKKPAFGGYSVSFKGCSDSMEDVFGNKGIAPSQMTKLLWAYVKKNKLAGK